MEDSTVLKPVVKPVQPAVGANGAPAHAAVQPIEEDSAEEQEEQPEATQKSEYLASSCGVVLAFTFSRLWTIATYSSNAVRVCSITFSCVVVCMAVVDSSEARVAVRPNMIAILCADLKALRCIMRLCCAYTTETTPKKSMEGLIGKLSFMLLCLPNT
jgi:hypothetical protein